MGRSLVLAGAGWRALWRTLEPLPHPSWTRPQAFAVHLVRELLERMCGELPEVQRRVLDAPAGRPPRGVVEDRIELAGRPALRWTSEEADVDRCILHFHGGGFVVGHPGESTHLGTMLAREAGIPVVSLAYGLAPEHPLPAAVEDGHAAVEALLGSHRPQHLLLAGDSAGGGLALRLLQGRRERREPPLAGAILGSPWVDLTQPGGSVRSNEASDYLSARVLEGWAALACEEPASPECSPGRGDLRGLPPLLFLAGELEILRDDILACADACVEVGVEVERVLGEGAVHCWHTNPALPGPRDTAAVMVRFARQRLGLDPTPPPAR